MPVPCACGRDKTHMGEGKGRPPLARPPVIRSPQHLAVGSQHQPTGVDAQTRLPLTRLMSQFVPSSPSSPQPKISALPLSCPCCYKHCNQRPSAVSQGLAERGMESGDACQRLAWLGASQLAHGWLWVEGFATHPLSSQPPCVCWLLRIPFHKCKPDFQGARRQMPNAG